MNNLLKKYNKEVVPKFKEKFEERNILSIPRISKVVLNCGLGKYLKEKEAVDEIVQGLRDISGQMPVLTKAKKSISGFKIRQGQEVGVVVTLRGERMWSFLDRLISSALPRIRDFRGIDPKNFDKTGNLNLAVKEHTVFPEIMAENAKNIFSFQVTVVTTAKKREEGIEIIKMLRFPIKSE
ncbi:MAG: 50S ribosomal protein L5 [Parcubacteria group bacterium]|jgi:large subunit ribosomal protein L5